VKNLAVARRYAKALLLIGKDDGRAEDYKEELGTVTAIMAGDRRLEAAISNPSYRALERKKLLQKITEVLELSDIMKSFVLLLFEKRRLGFISHINEFYKKLADELKGVARASVVSAAKLPEETVEKIQAALSKRTGKKVILELRQDPGLIGGVVTRIGDLVLDGSVKTQLIKMREPLKRGEGD
jgi:F-type H+-transporting ATPase subunit delta